jgi:hypothetical protein
VRQPVSTQKPVTSQELTECLRAAEWHGEETDRPEGARYVNVSETLAERIILSLNRLEVEISAIKAARHL